MDRLGAPPPVHELACQPVEQLGMARRRALGAEIVVGLDESVPKYACQIRFTVTRAVRGFRRSTSHRARAGRSIPSLPRNAFSFAASPRSTAGTPAVTSTPSRVKSPPKRT